MKKIIVKLIAVALTMVMFVSAVPMQAFAKEISVADIFKAHTEQVDLDSEQENADEASAEILYEVTNKRDEYTKVYKKSDNTYTAMVSAVPVHYQRDGEWVEIDNTLERTKNKKLENVNNAFHVSFPEKLTENGSISVEKDGYKICFSVVGVADKKAKVKNKKSTVNENKEEMLADTVSGKLSSTVTYKNVFAHTDLEYILSAAAVKENIIIKKASAAQENYCFNISADGLHCVLSETGELQFLSEDGTEVFKIPAPVMIDANGLTSEDISVEFSAAENGQYLLKYTPSEEWLNSTDRKYPVKIDPVVETDVYTQLRSFVTERYPDENFYDTYENIEITPENYWYYGISETYLIPIPKEDLSSGKNIIDVTLCMRGQVNGILGLYNIIGSWDPMKVTYNTRPQISEDFIDFYCGKENYYSDGAWVNFDVTEIYCDGMSFGSDSYGFALRLMGDVYEEDIYDEEGIYDGDIQDWYAVFNRLPEEDQNEMYLIYEYTEPKSYANSSEYQSMSAGRAGTVMVNDFSRALSVQRDDISISGNLMPVSISFMFNGIDAWNPSYKYYNAAQSKYINADVCPSPYGQRWLSNYNQMFFVENEGTPEEQFAYYTGNGKVIPLSVTKENGKWAIEEAYTDIYGTSGYTFFLETSEGDTRPFRELLNCVTVRTPDGNLQKYDANGRLIKIFREKYPNQSIDIAYMSNLQSYSNYFAIRYITDGANRKYDFTYSSGMLESIQCYTSGGKVITAGSTENPLKMTYAYKDKSLQSVTFPDNKTVQYDCYFDGDMHEVKNIDGFTLSISYSDENVWLLHESVTGDDGASVWGNSITFEETDSNQIKISYGAGKAETKRFDKYGRLIMLIDQNGNCRTYDYKNSVGGEPTESEVYSAGGNLLQNHSFEEGFSDWKTEEFTSGDISAQYYNAGNHSLKICGSASAVKRVSQTVTDLAAGNYTFSAFIKSCDTDTENKLVMKLTALSASGSVLKEESREIAASGEDFAQYALTAEAPSGTASVTVSIETDGQAGEFYVDDLQLEKGAFASSLNYAVNGNFQNGIFGWQRTGCYPRFCATELNHSNVPSAWITPGIFEKCKFGSSVPVNAKKGDIITIGVWLRADRLILDGPDCIEDISSEIDMRSADFSAAYTYIDENGEQKTENSVIWLWERMNDWYYRTITFELKGDCDSVNVALQAENIFSEIGIAGLTVSKVTPSADTSQVESPEDVPAVESFCACGDSCAYGYGCECTCASAETCTCEQCKGCSCADCTEFRCECRCESEAVCTCPQCKKKFDITYDAFGNLLSMKIMGMDMGELIAMMASMSYDLSGNYMTSSTDENGETIRYSYNRDNGILDSMTDARGNLTKYTYDAIGALTEIKTPVSALTNLLSDDMITAYEYTNDRVSSIKHNDFAYNIVYDAWGNVKTIYLGALDTALTIPFVDYEYGTGEYRSRIQKVSFKNDSSITYRYSGEHLTGISYDDGKTYQYEYSYDELGYLTRIRDNTQSRTVYYNADSVEVYAIGKLVYKAYTDREDNLIELIDGTKFVTKQYDAVQAGDTKENASKSGISVGDRELNVIANTDKFGRKTEQTVFTGAPDSLDSPASMIVTDYSYARRTDGGESAVGSRVDTMTSTVKTSPTQATASYAFSYVYDANNNITHEYAVNENGTKSLRCRYTYDEANQLVRTDDNVAGKTYVYAYNKGGNRISVKTYAYTLTNTLGDAKSTVYGLFGDPVWRDRMTSFNGNIIIYDSLGNPVAYDGKSYKWEGRQLKSISTSDGKTEFSYDADGLRTAKRVYTGNNKLKQEVKYFWKDGVLDSQILTEGSTSTTVKLLYDSNKKAVGFITDDGKATMFVKNLQGDVLALADESGKVVLEYRYDPWGNMTYIAKNGTTQAQAARLVQLCPISYRGYNYDVSTGLYYLQSRYYSPEWGRFLNCDDTAILLATQGETHGANLFAYGNNNSVNNTDYTGYWGEDVHDGYYKFSVSAKKINGRNYGTYYWALDAGFSEKNAKIVAYHCFDVDRQFPAWIPSKSNQAWHFNVNKWTARSDSRLEHFVFCFLLADSYFTLANQYYFNNKRFLSSVTLTEGLKYLGYAIHPIQDIFAHTDAVVKYETTLGVGYYSHLSVPNVDDAKVHSDVIFGEVEPITIAMLSYFTDTYYTLLKNVDGVEYNGIYIIM